MARDKNPYLPLFVDDFANDEKLRECSAEATGVYIRLMCVMHKSDTYGRVLLPCLPATCYDFARRLLKQMPYELDVIHRGLTELVDNGVIFIEGLTLCQKRMIRDISISGVRSDAGRLGGFAKAKGLANGLAKHVAKPLANTGIEWNGMELREKEEGAEEEGEMFRVFEDAVRAYPDVKRNSMAEWEDFVLVADPSDAVLLEPAIQAQTVWRETLEPDSKKRQWPNMKRWIAEKRWLIEIPKVEKQSRKIVV